jgi:hypothetical protein
MIKTVITKGFHGKVTGLHYVTQETSLKHIIEDFKLIIIMKIILMMTFDV